MIPRKTSPTDTTTVRAKVAAISFSSSRSVPLAPHSCSLDGCDSFEELVALDDDDSDVVRVTSSEPTVEYLEQKRYEEEEKGGISEKQRERERETDRQRQTCIMKGDASSMQQTRLRKMMKPTAGI